MRWPVRKMLKMPRRSVVVLFLFAAQVSAGWPQEATQSERGRALATRMCAQCHAIDGADESPDPNAPAFRRLQRLLDFDTFADRLREGLMVAHPDMPAFRFTRQDAHAVAAYLTSIQPQQPGK